MTPRWNQTDLAILKKFRFGEVRYLEVRGEARNVQLGARFVF